MNFAEFITENMEAILQEWEDYASSLPADKLMTKDDLRDHAKVMLTTMAKDLMSPQSSKQQQNKSVGKFDNPGDLSEQLDDKASSHGEDRLNSGFSIQDVVSEFRALRASVLRLWEKNPQFAQTTDFNEINRFNESVDQVLAQSVEIYAHQKEQKIRLYEIALQISPDLNYILNKKCEFIFANKAMVKKLGDDLTKIVGKRVNQFANIKGSEWDLAFKKTVQNKSEVRGETRYSLNDGQICFYEFILMPILDFSGEVEAIAVTERNVTERKSWEEAMWHQANFDQLTNLPNRSLFLDRLHQQIKNSERSNLLAALFFIDLDNFKSANDNYGHEIGDNLLQQVALRITSCVRQNDTVSRLGGDEFTVILTEFEHINHVKKVADKIIVQLSKLFLINGNTINISASIGIALTPQDATNPEALISHADQAMYAAKNKGRNQYKFYSEI